MLDFQVMLVAWVWDVVGVKSSQANRGRMEKVQATLARFSFHTMISLFGQALEMAYLRRLP